MQTRPNAVLTGIQSEYERESRFADDLEKGSIELGRVCEGSVGPAAAGRESLYMELE